jgi:methylmalonyl-CoA mutase
MSEKTQNGGQQTNGENAPLFRDFPIPSYEEWREVTEKSLKGASFEKKLLTKTYEGITLQPMYRQQDIEGLSHVQTMPGFPPYVRSTTASGYLVSGWGIAQEIPYATPKTFNEALRYDLERGQSIANIVLDQATLAGTDPDQSKVGEVGHGGLSIASASDFVDALDGIDLEQTAIIVRAAAMGLPLTALLAAATQRKGQQPSVLHGWIENDPLGWLARTGTLPTSLEHAYDEMAHLTAWAAANAPRLRTIAVHGHPYHNSGANLVQELAYNLATGVSYLRAMSERGLSIDTAGNHLMFGFSVGSTLFMEIAKLRAARMLWARIVEAFGGGEEAQKMKIHVRTSLWNKTTYDPYVNMLRTTVEAFGGSIGGCESMHVSPFDEALQEPDEFSRRIARNTQLILQQECNFNRLVDPAGGSWYVEHLTDELARLAWGQFQEVEQQGGIFAALQAGTPQNAIAEVSKARAKSLATRKDVLVGINMYPNLYEKKLSPHAIDYDTVYNERSSQIAQMRGAGGNAEDHTAALEKLSGMLDSAAAERVDAAIAAANANATLGEITRTLRLKSGEGPSITPLNIHRGAAMFENLRKAAEAYKAQNGTLPQVFLANMGPLVQHKARADFTTGFLEVGGFEMIRPSGFETPEDAAKAAIDSGAGIVVICSTDDTYPDIVPPLTSAIKQAKPDMTVLLAGYPQDHVESFKATGVDDFIHLRADCYAMNVKLQQQIGVSA